jgi:hypothetical protein
MPERASASQLLSIFIKHEKLHKNSARLPGWPGLLSQPRIDWNLPVQRAIAAHQALTLVQSDRPLKKAFEAFGLDPRNPFEWPKLLGYFAAAHYGSKGRGAPTKWTEERMCRFLTDVLRTCTRHPKGSRKDIWKWMKKDKSFTGQYDIPYETWRKQYRQALNWAVSYHAGHRKHGSQTKSLGK